jgi:hypothetical protein
MMPETIHQTAALIEKVDAAGLSALAGSIVAIPIPAASIVSRTWTTNATTTPAKIAPHATRLIMMVWASSSMVGRVRVAVVCTPDGSCTAVVSGYWVNGVNLCSDGPDGRCYGWSGAGDAIIILVRMAAGSGSRPAP